MICLPSSSIFFFFFNDTATTEIYTLSLHDALPIYPGFSTAQAVTAVSGRGVGMDVVNTNIQLIGGTVEIRSEQGDRKSTRLNSSHANISYAVFCLKKKNILQPGRALDVSHLIGARM